MQMPPMAATTGFLLSSAIRMSVASVGSADDAGVLNSRMSAPPEKALPAPIMTTASICESPFARSSPAAIAERTTCPRPLTGGLSIVRTAMRPFVS